MKYYTQNPERLKYESPKYRETLGRKIELRQQNRLKHKELESEM